MVFREKFEPEFSTIYHEKLPVHCIFIFMMVFKKTDFLQNGAPLRTNFVPLDVELNNQGNLPDLLLHPHNLRLVQKFLREWNRYQI